MPINTKLMGKVLIPSDFTLEIQGITLTDGGVIDINNTKLTFVLLDMYDNQYVAISNPNGESCHTYISDNKLYIVVEKYQLQEGPIYAKLCVSVPNSNFADGWEDTWFEKQKLSVSLSNTSGSTLTVPYVTSFVLPSFAAKIEVVEVNSEALPITDRTVNIDIPIMSISVDGKQIQPVDRNVDIILPDIDGMINEKVEAERDERIDADTELDSKIDTIGAELDSKINDEISTRESNEQSINDKIDAEIDEVYEYIDEQIEDVVSKTDELISGIQNTKVDKIEGKGLSTNDFTDEYAAKLDSITSPMQLMGVVKTIDELPTDAKIGYAYLVGEDTADEFEEYVCVSTNPIKWECLGKAAPKQIQSDWNETEETSIAFIKNKPNLDEFGKIDKILVNGVEQEIVDKAVDITVPIYEELTEEEVQAIIDEENI